MRSFILLLAVTAIVLSAAAALGDVGDQLFKLLPDDGAENDRFGGSVGINRTTSIVGAGGDDDNGPNSGSAYLFDTTTGQQIAKLLPDDGAAGDSFGVSVAISGETAIVGAPRDDDNGSHSGSAYLFDTTTAHQMAKLLADDGEVNDDFGHSVAICGEIVIVGARYDNDNGSLSGSAYLFDISDPAYPAQIAKLLPNDGAAGDIFGYSVAISGTTAIVGAGSDDDNGYRSGSAYLFDIATGQQIAKLLPNDGAALDYFGFSVAISGTTAIVGAAWNDDYGTDSGSVYLFDTTTGAQIAKLLPDDGAAGDRFGISVAVNGTSMLVGLRPNEDNGERPGAAYLFDITTGRQIAKLLPDDSAAGDNFGVSVGINSTTAIVGAMGDDDNGADSGSAYVIDAGGASDCPEDSDGRVTICHISPGNPDNAHTIRVGVNAVPAHLAHGDHCGPCEGDGLLIGSGGDAGHGLCPTDVDNSGDVGAADLAELLGFWGPSPGHPADLDGDGEVGLLDLALVLSNWGPCP